MNEGKLVTRKADGLATPTGNEYFKKDEESKPLAVKAGLDNEVKNANPLSHYLATESFAIITPDK